MLGRHWHWTLKGKIYPFLKEKRRHGRWILLLSGFPESAWTFNFSTCIHFHPVHPRSILVCGSSFFDTLFIPVCHLLVYPMIGQFWQFTSTLMSITWLRACKVKQTWRACEPPLPPPLHRTFGHVDIWHWDARNGFPESGWGFGRTEVFKKMLQSLLRLLSVIFRSPVVFARQHWPRAWHKVLWHIFRWLCIVRMCNQMVTSEVKE